MRLRILGCHGGESPEHHNTSFLVDGHILLDAGALTRTLTVPEQLQVDHVFLSHVHLDHIRDLAMLSDNVIATRQQPVSVHCAPFTADALLQHFFNNVIWPDFTKIPNPADATGAPVIKLCRHAPQEAIAIPGYTAFTVPVNHPVDCQALFLRDARGTLVYSGDTGPTQALWQALNQVHDLLAVICEVSFPNGQERLAQVSGHLTPAMLASELEKFRSQTKAPIFLYHMKPGAQPLLRQQIAALNDSRLHILELGEQFDL